MQKIQKIIEQLWQEKLNGKYIADSQSIDAVKDAMKMLDRGEVRICEKESGEWQVNQWVKKAILLYFSSHKSTVVNDGSDNYFDKVPLKCASWKEEDFLQAGFRYVPGAKVRAFSYIGKNAVIMPSYINIGAYVGEGTMVDTWATIGSCAQIGKNCHISGGAGIGGVLEPLQANPVIIEDNCFIGARSEIAEGVIVQEGSVISMGVYIGKSTKIYDRATGEISYGVVPAYSVVVPGTLPGSDGKTQVYAAIIVKTVDATTRSKTSINEILRDR